MAGNGFLSKIFARWHNAAALMYTSCVISASPSKSGGHFFDYYVGSTMAEQGNQADEDENWLYARLDTKKIKPSGLQVDAFCDRVWELLSTKGLLVNEARRIALEEIWGRR